MKQTIYADVLLVVNLFINYFLLLAVRGFLRISCKRIRLLLASAVGAISSFIIFIPSMPMLLSLVIRFILSVAIVKTAFTKMDFLHTMRAIGCFYIISFLFAGIMTAIWYFISPQGIVVKNSIVYLDLSPLLLAVLTIVTYFIVGLIQKMAGHGEIKNSFCKLCVEKDGKSISCIGKIDTGNALTEPFSQDPVIIMPLSIVKEIIPMSMFEVLEGTQTVSQEKVPEQIRLIPFSDLSGKGVLPSFRPDVVTITVDKKRIETKKCYIAVCIDSLCGGVFEALLNPAVLLSGKNKEERGLFHDI